MIEKKEKVSDEMIKEEVRKIKEAVRKLLTPDE